MFCLRMLGVGIRHWSIITVTPINFFVPGVPAPGGSKRFVGFGKRTGSAILVDDAGQRNKNWRAMVAAVAHNHRPAELLRCPLDVCLMFVMPRPKYHYGSGKNSGKLKGGAPIWHT